MQVVINLSEMNLVRGFLSLNYRQWKAKIEKVTFYCSVVFYPEISGQNPESWGQTRRAGNPNYD